MLYYVHGLHEGGCGTIQLQDVQMAQYLFGNNYKQYTANNYKQYTAYSTELNGARGVRATSCSRLVCKMEITSRECYSFCVISYRVLGMSRSLSSM